MTGDRVTVHLLFADHGTFHDAQITVPAACLEPYPRLIDALREDPELQKEVYLDIARLSAAWLPEGGEAAARAKALGR